MKLYAHCVGLAIVAACNAYCSNLASAQAYSNNGKSDFPIRKTHGNAFEIGNANEAPSDDKGNHPSSNLASVNLKRSHGSYSRNQSPPLTLTPSHGSYPNQEFQSVPFTGRYQNSCLGNILILENPKEIFVYVNGKSVRAKDAAELLRMSPDAYRLYDRTLGHDKRLFLARFSEWKRRFPDTVQMFGNELGGGE